MVCSNQKFASVIAAKFAEVYRTQHRQTTDQSLETETGPQRLRGLLPQTLNYYVAVVSNELFNDCDYY